MKKENGWKIGCIVFIIITILLCIYVIILNTNKNENETITNNNNNSVDTTNIKTDVTNSNETNNNITTSNNNENSTQPTNNSENNTGNTSNITNISSDTKKHMATDISISENISIDGIVENVENVKWSNADIIQKSNNIMINIVLNNQLSDKKIPAKTLTVNLLDKNGKIIASKSNIKMNEIDASGYTYLDATFETKDMAIIYGIQIIGN